MDLTAQIEAAIDELYESGEWSYRITQKMVAEKLNISPQQIFERFPYNYQWDALKDKVHKRFINPSHPTYGARMKQLETDYLAALQQNEVNQ